MKETFQNVIDRYQRVYGLPSVDPHHDAVHAMSGLGIGVCDELRVAAIECGLHHPNTFVPPEGLFWQQCGILKAMLQTYDEQILEGRTTPYNVSQLRAQALTRQEAVEFFHFGRDMAHAFHKKTGIDFMKIKTGDLQRLDFKGLDFSAKAADIRARHERPTNAAVARAMTRAFRQSADRWGTRKSAIPDAGKSWRHQPAKRYP